MKKHSYLSRERLSLSRRSLRFSHSHKMRLLVHSARQVVTITDGEEKCLRGNQMSSIQVLQDDIAVAVDEFGNIAAVGPTKEIREKWKDEEFEHIIDASGMCVLPGFVDAHTHPIWAGDRVHEFAMKLAGASYLEIHEAGGGIFFTVDHTVNSTEESLYSTLCDRLQNMLHAGTTTVEVKTGYGLETEAELKLLRVLGHAQKELPIELSITHCGAHAVPRGKTAEEATEELVCSQIPMLKSVMEQGLAKIENIDVFCEKGVFNVQQSRKILQAGKDIGLRINFHGDELSPTGGAEMGAELGATAISHLEEISEKGIEMMASAGTVAVMLPTTAFLMHLKPPPARRMITAQVPIALGTDFNPNAYCLAMPIVMNLACITMGMSMPEALVAATLNAAAALGRGHTHGAIQKGRVGDLVILDAPKWEHIIYQFGMHHQLIYTVIKKGKIVYTRK